jgi:hypothetical protein
MAGMNGQQIYDNFRNGMGPDGLFAGAEMVKEVSSRYLERVDELRTLLAKMQPAWQGRAADRAHVGALPLLLAHQIAGASLDKAQDLTNRQGGSFTDARNTVVPVPPKPKPVDFLQMVVSPEATIVDYESEMDMHTAAAQHNVDTMNRYGGATRYNVENLPTTYDTRFEDTPTMSVDRPTTVDSDSFVKAPRRDAGRRPVDIAHVDSPVPGGPEPTTGSSPPPRVSVPDTGTATTPEAVTPSTTAPVTPSGLRGPSGSFLPSPDTTASESLPRTSPGTPAVFGAVGGPGGGIDVGRRAVPRPGAPRVGPLAGIGTVAEPPGTAQRTTGAPAVAGRGTAAGAGGMPMGVGRGRDDEDRERRRPRYLEGGDPEDLFDSDVLTAPPTIGAEDE